MPDASTRSRYRMGIAVLAALFVLAAATTPAAAHAVLVRSSLTGHGVPPRTSTTVTLQFDAAVNVALSRVELLTGTGDKHPLQIAAVKPGEVVVTLPPLAVGVYGLQYRIMASDGHWTSEIARFRVADQK